MNQLIRKPPQLSWEVAGSLYVVGVTAYAAVRAVSPQPGETVAVSAAAGGVGSLVVQLLVLREARVLGIAGNPNADWLRAHGATPIAYGDGLADRLREAAPNGIDAFIDLFGPDYVHSPLISVWRPSESTPSSRLRRRAKSAPRPRAARRLRQGKCSAKWPPLVVTGALEFDIAATYPLDRVADAFEELEQRHTHGKIVLLPNGSH